MSTDKSAPKTGLPTDKPAKPSENTATDERKGKDLRGFEELGSGDPPDGDSDGDDG